MKPNSETDIGQVRKGYLGPKVKSHFIFYIIVQNNQVPPNCEAVLL